MIALVFDHFGHCAPVVYDESSRLTPFCCAQTHVVLADVPPVATTAVLCELEPAAALQPTPSPPGSSTPHTTRPATSYSPSQPATAHDDYAQPADSKSQQMVTMVYVLLLCMLRLRVSALNHICRGWSVVAKIWCDILDSTRVSAAICARTWSRSAQSGMSFCIMWRQSAKVCLSASTHWLATAAARAVVYCSSTLTAWQHLLVSSSATADWRLVLSVVGCVALMLFAHCLMDWVWDLSLVVLPPAVCALSCGVAAQVTLPCCGSKHALHSALW